MLVQGVREFGINRVFIKEKLIISNLYNNMLRNRKIIFSYYVIMIWSGVLRNKTVEYKKKKKKKNPRLFSRFCCKR